MQPEAAPRGEPLLNKIQGKVSPVSFKQICHHLSYLSTVLKMTLEDLRIYIIIDRITVEGFFMLQKFFFYLNAFSCASTKNLPTAQLHGKTIEKQRE